MRIPKGSAKTPRPKRASDELYNARRRMKREAERLERESKKAGASGKDKLDRRIDALRKAADRLYVDRFVQGAKRGSDAMKAAIEKAVDKAYASSKLSLKGNKVTADALRGKAGKRLMSYTESLWHGIPDKDERLKKVMDWLGVKEPTEIFDAFKARTGIDLTEVPPDEPEKYDYYVRITAKAILKAHNV